MKGTTDSGHGAYVAYPGGCYGVYSAYPGRYSRAYGRYSGGYSNRSNVAGRRTLIPRYYRGWGY